LDRTLVQIADYILRLHLVIAHRLHRACMLLILRHTSPGLSRDIILTMTQIILSCHKNCRTF